MDSDIIHHQSKDQTQRHTSHEPHILPSFGNVAMNSCLLSESVIYSQCRLALVAPFLSSPYSYLHISLLHAE
jgi:hypothetical protein